MPPPLDWEKQQTLLSLLAEHRVRNCPGGTGYWKRYNPLCLLQRPYQHPCLNFIYSKAALRTQVKIIVVSIPARTAVTTYPASTRKYETNAPDDIDTIPATLFLILSLFIMVIHSTLSMRLPLLNFILVKILYTRFDRR